MKINSAQAAEKLGSHIKTIHDLVKAGKLTDYAPRKNDGKRHYSRLDSREITAFKKVYRKKTHINNYPVASELLKKKAAVTPKLERVKAPVIHQTRQQVPLSGITSRIERIENVLSSIELKLDGLNKLWE